MPIVTEQTLRVVVLTKQRLVAEMIKLIKAHRIAGCPHCAPKSPDPIPAQFATRPPVARIA